MNKMGDHRFEFKAYMVFHDIKEEIHLGWCNWSGGESGIDSRITDWIEKVRDKGYRKFYEEYDKYLEEQNKEIKEKEERAQLAKLKAKYE